MRTRNQSNRLQPSTGDQQQSAGKRKRKVRVSDSTVDKSNDNETLSNVSRGAVGNLLKRVKKGFDREDVGYLQSEAKIELGSNGNEKDESGTSVKKNTTDSENTGVGAKCDTPLKENIVGVSEHSNPLNNDDENDFDWEDGDIPTLSSCNDLREDLTNGVSVEFDVLPGPAKRKPVRRATAEEKEVAEYVHKVHLLCLLGRGRLIDAACSDPLLQASLLSILPAHLLNIADAPKLTANRLSFVVSWFQKYFHVRSHSADDKPCHLALASTLETQEGTPETLAALSVALFRALNLTSRFVSILDVVSFKPDAESCESTPNKLVSKRNRNIFNSSTLTVAKESCSLVESDLEHEPVTADNAKDKTSDIQPSHQNSEGIRRKGDLEFEMQLEMALSSTAVESCRNSPSTSSSTRPFRRMKKITMEESQKCSSSSNGGVSIAIGSKKVGAPLYWAEVFCGGENLTGKWVHVDVVNGIIDGEYKVEAAAAACKKSMRYVVVFAGNGAKDVTRRYCTKWYKVASQRINPIWWDAVVAPLKELESVATNCAEENSFVSTRSSLEDMELQTRALTEPLPTNQQAYKNHHLYVIERWLKKYEILYPNGPVLGFCSGHAVYPRTCVQVTHTRERWLRSGLQVKAGELPVKVLKRLPKNGKEEVEKDDECDGDDHEGSSTDLYGKWQTEPLCLPHAVNGIVPKNERGRVDVWCEKSLPPGTVHLRLPRVARIARRLEIDFAEAMVGFEYRNGGSVPVFEGIVVCSEFKDVILEAYAEEEERREAEEKRRNEREALSRWYQLLSSIITRQRLNNRYGNDGSSASQVSADVPKLEDNILNSAADVTNKVASREMKIPKEQSHGTSSSVFTVNPDGNHEHEFVLVEREADEEGSTRVKRCFCGFSIEFEEL